MKTVLVTGSNGQLGNCLKDLESQHPNLHFLFLSGSDLDITDLSQIESIFKKNKIDWCINCAAYTKVDLAESESPLAFQVNEMGAKNISQVCKVNKVKLIHISTDFVFDGAKKRPYIEEDETNPINVYGLSKLRGEQLIRSSLKEHFIIRTSWMFSEHGNNFLKTMLFLSESRNEINVVNDQCGVPTYAGDLAVVILNIIENDITNYGVFHYCNHGETTWFGFAKEIFSLINSNIRVNPISSAQYLTPAKRPSYSVLDNAKIKETLSIEIPNWKSSLKKAIIKIK